MKVTQVPMDEELLQAVNRKARTSRSTRAAFRWHFTRSAGQFDVFLTPTPLSLRSLASRSFPSQRLSFGRLWELKLR